METKDNPEICNDTILYNQEETLNIINNEESITDYEPDFNKYLENKNNISNLNNEIKYINYDKPLIIPCDESNYESNEGDFKLISDQIKFIDMIKNNINNENKNLLHKSNIINKYILSEDIDDDIPLKKLNNIKQSIKIESMENIINKINNNIESIEHNINKSANNFKSVENNNVEQKLDSIKNDINESINIIESLENIMNKINNKSLKNTEKEITTDGLDFEDYNKLNIKNFNVGDCIACERIYKIDLTSSIEGHCYCWHCLFLLHEDNDGIQKLKDIYNLTVDKYIEICKNEHNTENCFLKKKNIKCILCEELEKKENGSIIIYI